MKAISGEMVSLKYTDNEMVLLMSTDNEMFSLNDIIFWGIDNDLNDVTKINYCVALLCVVP